MTQQQQQATNQYSMFKTKTNSCCHSNQNEEDDQEQIIDACQQQRRLSRLYGSKKGRHMNKGRRRTKTRKNENDDCSNKYNGPVKKETTLGNNNNEDDLKQGKTKTIQKFFDRSRDELSVDIHADNYNISHPWFVGYQNTTSLQGSPYALASRYVINNLWIFVYSFQLSCYTHGCILINQVIVSLLFFFVSL